MNPKRVKYLHIFIWLFAFSVNFPYRQFGKGMPAGQLVSNILAFLYLMVVFYVFYLVVVPRFLKKNRFIGFLLSSLAVILIMPYFGYTFLFLARAVFDGNFRDFYAGYSLKTHMSAFYPVLTAAVFGSFFRVIINWFRTIDQNAEIMRQKLAIELDLLKSKLNPHFLFNTLNNIDSLIRRDPEEASSALIKLSGMMRYLTYETTRDTVEISREVDYIRDFIDLQRMRIRNPEDIIFTSGGDPSIRISPALFVPLIENAFKYGCAGNTRPRIDINLHSENEKISFAISNSYLKQTTDRESAGGYGLVNLRKRLELSYPGKHTLEIKDENNNYSVMLMLEV